jgi:hypothetical protein
LSAADVNEENDEAVDEQEAANENLSLPLKPAIIHASMPAVQITAQVTADPDAREHGKLHALSHWVNNSKYFRTTLHTIVHGSLLQLASISVPEKHGVLLVLMLACIVMIVMLWLRSVREELHQIDTNQLPSGRKSPLRTASRLYLGKGGDFPSYGTVPASPRRAPTTNDMLARCGSGPVLPSQQSLAHMLSPRRHSMSGPLSAQPLTRIQACLCPELVVPDRHECYVMFPEIDKSAASTSGILCISVANGMAMLYAAYNILPGYTSGKRLVLTSALDERVLASCEDAKPDTAAEPRLKVLNGAEEEQGMLHAGNTDTVVLKNGARLEIRRDMRVGTCATDENGWLLACAAPAQEDGCRMLRISPRVDAGLVILAMLGADILVLAFHAKMNERRSVEYVAGACND